MISGKKIFAQRLDFLPVYEFSINVPNDTMVITKCKTFRAGISSSCMAFAQLTYRESLRDIEACFLSGQQKLYHMGIPGKVSRNTLAHAKQVRDWRILCKLCPGSYCPCSASLCNDSFGVELSQIAYNLDSALIDLYLSPLPWAKFRKHKGAIKLHTLLDLRGNIPSMVIITHRKVHDVLILDQMSFEPGAFYIFDRGYPDFARLYAIHQDSAFFVTRAKNNFKFKRLYSRPVDKSQDVRSDQIIVLEGIYARKGTTTKNRAGFLISMPPPPKKNGSSF